MSSSPVAAAVAFAIGYLIGAVPVAWLLVRHRTGVDMRSRGVGGTGALNTLAVAGPQATAVTLALEIFKGALAGGLARLYSPDGWFVATAIAGCVLGDAFPVGLRRGGRGLLPLVSGLLVALPLAGLITGFLAIPAAMLRTARGRVYEAVVVVAVPGGLFFGTRQWQSLIPAAVIVAVLLARARLRRRDRPQLLRSGPAWRMVLDVPPATPARSGGGQNSGPWDPSSPTG